MKTPVIECVGVTKTFKGLAAVRDLSFNVSPGEIVSILGPSGSGKTTLLRLIAGLESPNSGQIFINGNLASNDRWQKTPDKRGLGMVMQEYALFPVLSSVQIQPAF